jgi:predicted AlkP superfamily pyrophosphatase or phosphodiesterase
MLKQLIFSIVIVLLSLKNQAQDSLYKNPKLLVGLVVDQMRYDYLFRFWDKLGENGFKRMIKEGYLFKNANYSYIPTYTAPGHATIYTGTTPSRHGIVANNWFDIAFGVSKYCVSDNRYNSIGTQTTEGEKSPDKMVVTTIGDEMKLMNNNHSKVISISLKDRSAILPGGHKANAVYWLSKEGKWITSSYYMNKLPNWVSAFNNERPASFYLGKKWEPMFPIMEYEESYSDDNEYEETHKWESSPVFPHDFSVITKEHGYGVIKYTPMGNTMTKDFAIKTIKKEQLGTDKYTDLLAISFSPIDYIGHYYGPHSIEMEDAIIQLDFEIGMLFKYIDKNIGKENVVYFLTADHGAVNVPKYLMDQKVPSGYFDGDACVKLLNSEFKKQFGLDSIVKNYTNSQIHLTEDLIELNKLDKALINAEVIKIISGFSGVSKVVSSSDIKVGTTDLVISQVKKGYYEGRCGSLYIILKPGWIHNQSKGTTHGSGYSYDTHVPLIFMGKGVKHGASNQKVNIEDIAPTISSIINVSFPNGTTGKPLRFE